MATRSVKKPTTRARATKAAAPRKASRPRAPRAQAESIGTMDQILSVAEHSGTALARRIEERPLMMLAGAGLIGLIAAAMFASNR